MTYKDFEIELKNWIVEELRNARSMFAGIRLSSFDFGVYPWYGYFELSFLTEEEQLSKWANIRFDIGDWKYYNFNNFQEQSSPHIRTIAQWMEEQYLSRREPHASTPFFLIAANVVNEKTVINELNKYEFTPDFNITVYDPDNASHYNYVKG